MAMTIRANFSVTVLGVLRPASKNPMHGAWFIAGALSWIALTLLMIFHTGVATAQDVPRAAAIARLYDRFQKAEAALDGLPPAARPAVMAEFYSANIASQQKPSVLQELPADSVDLLFRGTYDTTFYTLDRRYVKDMQADLDRLRALHADELHHYQDLYVTLVGVRDFVTARAVLASQPMASSESAPTIVGALFGGRGPSALVLSEDGLSASQQPILLSGALEIVVIGHPLCHFSRNAVAAIEADARLRAVFASHARWLMPQDGRMRPRTVAAWNVAHPLARMDYIYRQSDLAAIDTWATPTFYFFRNGRRVGKLSGWAPGGEGERALQEELEKLGFH
jgi:hypothetical protein